ncbi:tubule protein [Chenuda virus]|uniref:Non-structural protein NS1 n=1 Tax=Chenuda virus TaxID=40065 RepID=A0A0H4M5B6_9REOV|nr:tubule protein [Chenuda virus]AKP24089.1 tubule protein [Chenuda virus]
MEAFARNFRLTDEQVNALEFFEQFAQLWRCMHRRHDCRLDGRCVLENFHQIVNDVGVLRDAEKAERVATIIQRALANRREVWNQVLQAVQRGMVTSPSAAHQFFQAQHDVARGRVSARSIAWEGAEPDRVYYDDSRTLLPHLFVPTVNGECIEVLDGVRVGRYLLLFHDRLPAGVSFTYQREPAVLAITNHYLRWAAEAPRVGDELNVTWVVFLPFALRPLFDVTPFLPIIRTLDADTAFIRAQDTAHASRLFFQRFAVEGLGLHDVITLFERRLRGASLLELHLQNAMDLETVFFPTALMRGWFSGIYADAEVLPWFGSREHCQACFISTNTRHARILSVDSRMADYVEGDALRSLRAIRHGGADLEGISMTALAQDEMLTRVGDHWCAYPCRSPKEAVIVTATLLHKFLRGGGLAGEFLRLLAIDTISRAFLYWSPTGSDLAALFHLQLCTVSGEHCESVVATEDFRDLGRFLDALMRVRVRGSITQRAMYRSLLSAAFFALTRCVPAAARPTITPPRPRTVDNRRVRPPPPRR